MRSFAMYAIIIFIFSIVATSHAEKYALVRLNQKPLKKAVTQIEKSFMDITTVDPDGRFVEAIVSADDIELLKNQHSSIDILINDMDAYAAQLRQSGYFDHFHSYDDMLTELQHVAATYPNITALHDIGDSYLKVYDRGGHDIWALKISDQPAIDDSTEADVLLMATIHAREIITPEIILYFMNHLVHNYGKDAFITHLINNREIWLIPMINPDGHKVVFSGDINQRDNYPYDPIWWRKNCRDNDNSGDLNHVDGVDLNRNFDYKWGLDDEGSSPDSSSVTYRGPHPFSEPELMALRDFVEQHNFLISLSYHSYGNFWLFPWSYEGKYPPEPHFSVFKALADSCTAYNGYRSGNALDFLYAVNGDSDDWLFGVHGVYAFTPEVGTSRDSFWPDTTRIMDLILENMGPNLFVTYAAGEEPVVNLLSETPVLQDSFYTLEFEIKPPIVLTDSVGLDESTFALHYKIGKGSDFETVSMLKPDTTGGYQTHIPLDNVTTQSYIYFYASAADSLGRTGTYPRGAPMAVDSFIVQPLAVENRQITVQSAVLAPNYPNPFNQSTVINYNLPVPENVRLVLYNMAGQQVCTLVDDHQQAGEHYIKWRGKNESGIALPSGVYMCRLFTESTVQSRKILLLR